MPQDDFTYLDVQAREEENFLVLHGDWVIDNSAALRKDLKDNDVAGVSSIDATSIGRMDMWGAMQLQALADKTDGKLFLSEGQKRTFDFLPMKKVEAKEEERSSGLVALFENVGRIAVDGSKTLYGMTSFVGEIAVCFGRNIFSPRRFRFHSIVRHIDETGLRALPIVGLLAILISMVIAYQASTQLERFGATIFTVDLTVISILREMGVLITAIMVAGRSGSAFAAEIGVMKLREEVDALKTMGFNPIELLVLPRLIAMLLTLPMLAFLADIMGLIGGGVVSILLLDIAIDQYIGRVEQVIKPTMFFVGMIKAPIFAFVITVIGTYQGMNVSGSAESVGRLTTVAVVQSIFAVMLVDGLFSIIFSSLGL